MSLWTIDKGITQSFISSWLSCRELARLRYEEGYTRTKYSDALTFGTLVHGILEGVYTRWRDSYGDKSFKPVDFMKEFMLKLDADWQKEHPIANADELQQWEYCKAMADAVLPHYFQMWKSDFSPDACEWVSLEAEFEEPFEFTRTYGGAREQYQIWVRGKIDGIRKINGKLWLFETKTKTRIEDDMIMETLPLDLQVNLYCWAVYKIFNKLPQGITYNVIKRPSLRQGKQETSYQYIKRVSDDVHLRPAEYFSRFEVYLDEKEYSRNLYQIKKIIKEIKIWGSGVNRNKHHYKNPCNCAGKYGMCEMIGVCARDDYSGLRQRDILFPELSNPAERGVKSKDEKSKPNRKRSRAQGGNANA